MRGGPRHSVPATPGPGTSTGERVSLCEALDRVLNKGAVVVGEVTISVADIDLVYLGLQVVLTSIETARRLAGGAGPPTGTASTEVLDGAR